MSNFSRDNCKFLPRTVLFANNCPAKESLPNFLIKYCQNNSDSKNLSNSSFSGMVQFYLHCIVHFEALYKRPDTYIGYGYKS